MTGVIMAAVVVGLIGLLIGLLLGFAAKAFAVPVDEKEIEVREFLPGNNCGGCGYAGCDALAKAIAAGEAPVNACPVGGASVAEKIGNVMGVAAGESVKMVAYVTRLVSRQTIMEFPTVREQQQSRDVVIKHVHLAVWDSAHVLQHVNSMQFM